MLASSTLSSASSSGLVVAALVGGVIVARGLLFFAYFVAIALVGAGLGVMIVMTGWARYSPVDPPWVLVLLFAALGTLTALVLQRYVIVVSTAFGGAWTIIIGALAASSAIAAPPRRCPTSGFCIQPRRFPAQPGYRSRGWCSDSSARAYSSGRRAENVEWARSAQPSRIGG